MVLRRLAFVVAFLAVPTLALAGSPKDNEAALVHFYEQVNQGHLEALDQILGETFVEHEPLPGFEPDREGVKQWFALLRTAFPDLHFDVKFMMSDGDKVAAYLTISGTQAAEFLGVPSQGRSFSIETVDILRFENGKAVEHWGVTDSGALMQQLTGDAAPME